VSINNVSDHDTGAAFRAYLEWSSRGTLDDLRWIYDEIAESDRTSFPWRPAIVTLAVVPPRRLQRAFDDEELQELYDRASDAGLHDAAACFASACVTRPYLDDRRVPPEVKKLVIQRDGGRCKACGATDDLTIDHKLVPWIDGGSSKDPTNLHVLCRSCNASKGTRPWPLFSQDRPRELDGEKNG
jgi:hypothetical protein